MSAPVVTGSGTRAGDAVLVDRDAGVLRVTFNRPDRLNAVTADMLDDAADAVAAGSDPRVRVVALGGAGRYFCAGADLSTRQAPGTDPEPATIDAANRLVRAIRDVPRPVVAVVHGPAVGVGVSLVLAADIAVAARDAWLSLGFATVGLMPDGGATALVAAAAGRATAMRLALLEQPMPAVEAEDRGLIAAAHESSDLAAAVDDLLAVLARGPAQAYARTKEAVNRASLGALDAAFAIERSGQLELLASPDFAEGAAAFAEKRPPRFTAPP